MNSFTPLVFAVFAFVLVFSNTTSGQSIEREVVASSGDYFSNSTTSLSWTLGEPVTETVGDQSIILTQGFQQANIEITAIGDVPETSFTINVYPNPAVDFVNVDWQNEQNETIKIHLYDMNGKELINRETQDNKTVLDFASIPAANYLLSISKSNGELIKTYLIHKSK